MKKGDATKQEILSISERLFCTKGYEETSVQDILDIMHGTKGGFYHHFPTKAAVLETLCRNKADSFMTSAQRKMESVNDRVKRVNLLFQEMNPLRMEEISYMTMLLPILDKPEGMSVRVVYQEALLNAFHDALDAEIIKGTEEGVFLPVASDLATALLTLMNSCWLEASKLLIQAIEANRRCDSGMLYSMLTRYRRIMETLLDAPYGSMVLMDLENLDKLALHLTMTKRS